MLNIAWQVMRVVIASICAEFYQKILAKYNSQNI